MHVQRTPFRFFPILIMVPLCATAATGSFACSPRTVDVNGDTGGSGPRGGAGGRGGGFAPGTGGGLAPPDPCADGCTDFPAQPVIDGAPQDAPARFGDATAAGDGSGPCVVEPEAGAMIPANWVRPRFRWLAVSGQNLFELRVHSKKQKRDLVVYTSKDSWTMPAEMWTAVARNLRGGRLDITVRALGGAGKPSAPAVSSLLIAPVPAEGSIVYWTTRGSDAFDPEATELQGFQAGSETVVTVLTPAQIQQPTGDWNPTVQQPVKCIGCHASTPDGLYVGFTAQPPWGNVLAGIKPESAGQKPPFLSDAAIRALNQKQLGVITFSPAHWAAGDRIAISPYGDDVDEGVRPTKLAWFDLEATSSEENEGWGLLARTGDGRSAGAPDWSHDGKTIVYTSTRVQTTGRIGGNEEGHATAEADLYSIPYGDRQGGMATPVAGAAEPDANETYPDFSPDDRLIAYNKVPLGVPPYDQPLSELHVVPAAGGQSIRLAANDPPACAGLKSPGVKNSWPKWAPNIAQSGGSVYYWLTFSSARFGGKPQIYLAAVVETEGGLTTYPALYLWNQSATTGNHTPAWDHFAIAAD